MDLPLAFITTTPAALGLRLNLRRSACYGSGQSAGFPVGNHTFSHPNLENVETRAYTADIARMDQRLTELDLDGGSPSLTRTFRYPYLAEGDTVEKRNAVRDYLLANGYRIAAVTLDYDDWFWNDVYTRCLARDDVLALEQIRNQASDLALRRLHEAIRLARMIFSRDIRHIMAIHMCAFEADELDAILARYRAAGIRFITLDRAMLDRAMLDRAMEDPVYDLNSNCAPGTFLQQLAVPHRLQQLALRYPSIAPIV